jgi:predicted dehydrogenase
LLDSFADEFRIKKRFTDWRQLILDHDIDAVYIATPVHLHAEQAISAAQAGKHVLCEKPMAMNTVESDAMIAAAASNDVKLGVAYYRHFYPAISRIKELIAAGEIGKPIVAQINAFEWFDPLPTHPRAWLLKKKLSGGGPMMDFGCHRIEVLLNLFGRVRNVNAAGSNRFFSREVEDTAAALLAFEGGTLASLIVTHATRDSQDTLTVWGSQGSVQVEILNEGKLVVRGEAGERTEFHPPATNLHEPVIEDFVDAVINDRSPNVPGETGRMVGEIEDQIYSQIKL